MRQQRELQSILRHIAIIRKIDGPFNIGTTTVKNAILLAENTLDFLHVLDLQNHIDV